MTDKPLTTIITEPRAGTLRSVQLCGEEVDAIATFAVMVDGFQPDMREFCGQPVPFGVRPNFYAAEVTLAKLLLATRKNDLDNPTVTFTFRYGAGRPTRSHVWHFTTDGGVALSHVLLQVGPEYVGACTVTQEAPVEW